MMAYRLSDGTLDFGLCEGGFRLPWPSSPTLSLSLALALLRRDGFVLRHIRSTADLPTDRP